MSGLKELFAREVGVRGEVDAESSETGLVARTRDVCEVRFAAPEFGEFIHGELCRRVGGGTDAQGNQRLFQVKAYRALLEHVGLEIPHGLDEMVMSIGATIDSYTMNAHLVVTWGAWEKNIP